MERDNGGLGKNIERTEALKPRGVRAAGAAGSGLERGSDPRRRGGRRRTPLSARRGAHRVPEVPARSEVAGVGDFREHWA